MIEASMERFLRLDKDDFIGKAPTLVEQAARPAHEAGLPWRSTTPTRIAWATSRSITAASSSASPRPAPMATRSDKSLAFAYVDPSSQPWAPNSRSWSSPRCARPASSPNRSGMRRTRRLQRIVCHDVAPQCGKAVLDMISRPPHPLVGIGLMLPAMAILPFLDVVAKYLGQQGMPVLQIVWARLFFGTIRHPALRGEAGRAQRPHVQHAASCMPSAPVFLIAATGFFFWGLHYLSIADMPVDLLRPAADRHHCCRPWCWARRVGIAPLDGGRHRFHRHTDHHPARLPGAQPRRLPGAGWLAHRSPSTCC